LKEDYSNDYKKQIIAKLPLIFNKSVYKNKELVNAICDTCATINRSDRAIKLVRLILNYCEEKELLTEEQLTTCRKKIKNFMLISLCRKPAHNTAHLCADKGFR
jgi:intergrase/recombinase